MKTQEEKLLEKLAEQKEKQELKEQKEKQKQEEKLLKEKEKEEIKENKRMEKLNKEALKANQKKQIEEEKQKNSEIFNELTSEVESITSFIAIQDLREYPMYVYKNGVYEEYGDAWIRKYLSGKYINLNTGIFEEVIKRIRQKNLIPLSNLNSNKSKIILLNGVYNLETKQFEEHSPTNYSTIQLPINYKKDAQCLKLHQYFTEVLEPEFVSSAYEIFGYSLWKGNDFKKIFFLVGGNNSSKSTFMGIMRKFIGMKYISAMEMQRIAKDRFSAAELFGKSLNICGDTKSTMVKETGMLRMLSGNEDPIPGEKKFGGLFSFMNYCKMIFGFNILPHIPESEMEFFADRMFIVQFPNWFAKKPGYLDSITTEEEMSGLFNMAISGLQRAFDHKQLTNTLTKEEIIKQYAALAEPVTNFAYDAFEYDAASYIDKEKLFTVMFKNFLNIKHISYSESEDKFWKDLKDTMTKTGHDVDWNRRVLIDGVQKYCIYGVRLKEIYNIPEEVETDIPNQNDEPEPEFYKEPEIEIPNEIEYSENISEEEYKYYLELAEENEKSIMKLYEENFDHIEIPIEEQIIEEKIKIELPKKE